MTMLPATLVLSGLLSLAGPSSASTTAAERVTIASEGGVTIAGEYRHGGAGAPAVLFFAMCSGADGLQGWWPVADRLRDRGVSSLVIRSSGASDRWKSDGTAAIAYLRSRAGGATPLAVAGASCGVSMALVTALNNPETVRAVAVLTGP